MAELEIRDVSVAFGAKRALDGVSLRAESGSLVALLGPSGCGKTTLLSAICGMVQPESGDVLVDGGSLLSLPMEKRGIGMVFQNYALFRHMNVYDNVAYGLKLRHTPREEMRRRVAEALALVRLEGAEKRAVSRLSGGEQQRVALARAIILRPGLLLLDEPLSALDKKIRDQMQAEIRRIQRETGITTLFVTHDQSEALALADQVAVMDAGRIVEHGAPRQVYTAPQTRFGADFMGASNVLRGVYADGKVCIGSAELPAARPFPEGARVVVLVREENVAIVEQGIPATVRQAVFMGQITRAALDSPLGPLHAAAMSGAALEPGMQVCVELRAPSYFLDEEAGA